jgi:ribonuclease J
MIGLVKPKYSFGPRRVPPFAARRELARTMGIPAKNIIVSQIGKVIELDQKSCRVEATVPSGRVLIDGLGVATWGTLSCGPDSPGPGRPDRVVVTIDAASKMVVAGPDVVSRGCLCQRG